MIVRSTTVPKYSRRELLASISKIATLAIISKSLPVDGAVLGGLLRKRAAAGGGGSGGTWSSGITGGNESSIETGERGIKITVGASNVVVTKLGCWFSSGTYADMPMKIRDSGCNVVASGTVLLSGSTNNAFNFITLGSTYSMTASGTYYIVCVVSGYNGFQQGGSQTVTSVVSYVEPVDETCVNVGGYPSWAGGVNFQYSSP